MHLKIIPFRTNEAIGDASTEATAALAEEGPAANQGTLRGQVGGRPSEPGGQVLQVKIGKFVVHLWSGDKQIYFKTLTLFRIYVCLLSISKMTK